MPICARCVGAGIGSLLGVLAYIVWGLIPWEASLLLIIPMSLDWTIQSHLGIESTNARRLLTGVLGGFGILTVQVAGVLWAARAFL